MNDITKNMPHFVVKTDDAVHTICLADIRRLANGKCYRGDEQEMIRLLATIIKDMNSRA